MIKKNKLKEGLLLWWEAERNTKSWSTPVVVTAVEESRFKLRTLDDFVETPWIQTGDNSIQGNIILREMRPCSLEEIQKYFDTAKRDLKEKVRQKTKEQKEAVIKSTEFCVYAERFLKEHT